MSTSANETSAIPDRRSLHFTTLDEMLADANEMALADGHERLRTLGNWTFGQNLGHLASWINYSYDGAPLNVPWFVRLPVRLLMKNHTLNRPMKPGLRIPRVSGGTFGTEVFSTEVGLDQFDRACARLKVGPPATPHMLFGPLTHEEWIKQHLRHGELHLSFARAD